MNDDTSIDISTFPAAAAIVDGEGRLVAASPGFADLVGRDRDELAGRALLDLVAPDDRGRLAAAWAASDGGEVDVAGRRADGLPFVGSWSVPAGDLHERRVLIAARWGPPIRSIRDTPDTDTDGRDVLDSALSHDVRGALRGVAGFLTVLDRERESLPDESQGFLETARRSAATADTMAERLVEFARLARRPLVVAPVDLDDVLGEIVGDRALVDREGAPLEVTVGSLPAVVGDRTQLRALFSELLTNAAKFGARRVVISSRVDEGWLYVRVDDDGPGIDEAFRQRAFDLFRLLQAKGRYPGVGAGLAIARRIAEIHGGRLRIETGGSGATGESGATGGTALVVRLLLARIA